MAMNDNKDSVSGLRRPVVEVSGFDGESPFFLIVRVSIDVSRPPVTKVVGDIVATCAIVELVVIEVNVKVRDVGEASTEQLLFSQKLHSAQFSTGQHCFAGYSPGRQKPKTVENSALDLCLNTQCNLFRNTG